MLNKVNYISNETIITAENLNEIQDRIINTKAYVDTTSTVATQNATNVSLAIEKMDEMQVTVVRENLGAISNAVGAVGATNIADGAISRDYTAPYSIAVTVNGILASNMPFVDLNPSATYAEAEQQIEAWSSIHRAVTAANTITLYATDKPSVSIPIKIKAVRK